MCIVRHSYVDLGPPVPILGFKCCILGILVHCIYAPGGDQLAYGRALFARNEAASELRIQVAQVPHYYRARCSINKLARFDEFLLHLNVVLCLQAVSGYLQNR